MDVTSFLTVFAATLAVVLAGGSPPPPSTTTTTPLEPIDKPECTCLANFNNTCENGRGYCSSHLDSANYAYFVCRSNCGAPPSEDNADVLEAITWDSTLEGNVMTYACTSGFSERPGDDMTVTCAFDGAWTPATFKCVCVCSVPDAPTGSTLVDPQSSYAADAIVTFECDEGYNTSSCITATCNGSTGQWDFSGGPCSEVCLEGWLPFEGSCYLFNSEPKRPFPASKAFCESNTANLVHVNNAAENTFIKNILIGFNDYRVSYWMGLSDAQTEGVYKWVDDDSEATFFDWGPTEPMSNYTGVEHCVVFFTRGHTYQWNDLRCKKVNGAVCERPPGVY